MNNKLIIATTASIILFLVYIVIFFVARQLSKPSIEKMDLPETTVEIYQCIKGTIIGSVFNKPLCFSGKSLNLQVDKKLTSLIDLKDIQSADDFFLLDQYLFIFFPQHISIFFIDIDTAKLVQLAELPSDTTNTIRKEAIKRENQLFLFYSRELIANSQPDNKTELHIISFDTTEKKLKQHIIKKLVEPLKLLTVSNSREGVDVLLEQSYPFLEKQFQLFHINEKMELSQISLACSSLTPNENTIQAIIFNNSDCKNLPMGSLWYKDGNFFELPSEMKADPDSLFWRSPSELVLIGENNIFRFSGNKVIKEEIQQKLKYNNFPLMQIQSKGSIIASERVYDYIDFKYSDQILYRLLLKRP